jgi:superfamily II DNA or RNA helicase
MPQESGYVSFEVAERSIAAARAAGLRGRRFEDACAYLLRSAPEYRLTAVWRWDQWPGRDSAGFVRQDLGIDLIGETRSGELWAIQAKFRTDPHDVIPWRELATFVGHSAGTGVFTHRLVITNTWDVSRRFAAATEHQRIGWIGRGELFAISIDWRPFLDPDVAPVAVRKTPRPHQVAAVADVVAHLWDHERGQLIMACGTGKTLTALWVADRRDDQRVLVLVPSLSLLRQFRREWLEASDPAKAFRDLCVCSDITVAGGHTRGLRDDLKERAADLGVPVTTSPTEIAAFMRGPGRRVVFATYQSSPRVAEAMADQAIPAFDLVIADEAHRLAAPVERSFGTILDDARIRASRRVFTTATPRYLAPRVIRRAAEEDVAVVSMDDPEIFGAVAHRLTFGQAIAQDLLSDYRVVVLATDDAEVAQLIGSRRFVRAGEDAPVTDATTLATLVGVARAVDDLALRRLISFHRTIERARTFARSAATDRLASGGIRLQAAYVSGDMTAGERAQRLDELRRADGHAVLLANARCLTEGVDVPALDGVVFVDPRWSPIDIVQAVGRVIRKSPDKTIGTIVIPVLVPDHADAEAVLADSAFDIVWSVVRALRSHDERLAEVLTGARTELGRTGKSRSRAFLGAHFGVLDLPTALDSRRFAEAIELRIVEAGSFSFDEAAGQVAAFAAQYGHTRVPQGHHVDGRDLGAWVTDQRIAHRKGQLRADRVYTLEAIPSWTWDPLEDDFQAGLAELQAFVAARGHARVPVTYETSSGFPLARWVVHRRTDYRKGAISGDRVAALEVLPGWTWKPFVDDFDEAYAALEQYVEAHGTARVPPGYRTPDGFWLARWIAKRRTAYHNGRLSAEQVAALERLPGWSWDPRDDDFHAGLAAFRDFVAQHGHARVPHGYVAPDGRRLRVWISGRRVDYHAGRLSAERVAALERIPGWSWEPRQDEFARAATALRRFVGERGTARVPQDYRTSDGLRLGVWVAVQRRRRGQGHLTREETRVLEALPGWSWDVIEDEFDEALMALESYVAEHGEARPPAKYVTIAGFKLGQWVSARRAHFHQRRLRADRIDALQRLPGWSWDPARDDFRRGCEALRSYAREHSDASVPFAYVDASGFRLGRWVGHRRSEYARGRLTQEQIRAIESVPRWDWVSRSGASRSSD